MEVNLNLDFRFVPAILGSYHVHIRTISYFSEICDQFPRRYYSVVTFLQVAFFYMEDDSFLPPLPWVARASYLASFAPTRSSMYKSII